MTLKMDIDTYSLYGHNQAPTKLLVQMRNTHATHAKIVGEQIFEVLFFAIIGILAS